MRRRSRYERYFEAFARLIHILSRPNTYALIGLVFLILLFLGTLVVWLFEQSGTENPARLDQQNSFVFMLQNTIGVGIGAQVPVTLSARVTGIIFVILASAARAFLVAALVSTFVNQILAQGKGIRRVNQEGHVIICGWNPRVKQIVQVLQREAYGGGVPIVLLANLQQNPLVDSQVKLVTGDASVESDLDRASVKTARAAIVITDESDGLHHNDSTHDARAVLTVLALKSVNPALHVVAEVRDPANRHHFERARADEMIVNAEMSEGLLARAAVNSGIAHVYSDLLRLDTLPEMYVTDAPSSVEDKTFQEALIHMQLRTNSILVGVIESDTVLLCPPPAYKIHSGSRLVVLSNMPSGKG
jgi:voltage-gated potassium channel